MNARTPDRILENLNAIDDEVRFADDPRWRAYQSEVRRSAQPLLRAGLGLQLLGLLLILAIWLTGRETSIGSDRNTSLAVIGFSTQFLGLVLVSVANHLRRRFAKVHPFKP